MTSPSKKLPGNDVRLAPVLKGLHINPSGQSTLAFDKRIRQAKRQQQLDDVELEQKVNFDHVQICPKTRLIRYSDMLLSPDSKHQVFGR